MHHSAVFLTRPVHRKQEQLEPSNTFIYPFWEAVYMEQIKHNSAVALQYTSMGMVFPSLLPSSNRTKGCLVKRVGRARVPLVVSLFTHRG